MRGAVAPAGWLAASGNLRTKALHLALPDRVCLRFKPRCPRGFTEMLPGARWLLGKPAGHGRAWEGSAPRLGDSVPQVED